MNQDRPAQATPETTADFAARLPGARLVVIEEASHSPHLEQPAAYLDAVAGFLCCMGNTVETA